MVFSKVSEPLSLTDSPKYSSRGNLVEVYDKDNKLLYRFDKLQSASASFFNISHPTVLRYIKNKKLWNNLYFFNVSSGIPSLPTPFPISTSEVSHSSLDKSCDNIQISTTSCTVEVYDPEGGLIY